MNHILVLDLGTTNYKASLFSTSGELRALCARAAPCPRASTGRHEIAIPKFLDAIEGLLRELEANHEGGFSDVAAVTFATQTNTFALLDEDDAPLTPFIVWDDARAESIAGELAPLLDVPTLYETTGVPELSTAFMVAKLAWFQREAPDAFARVARVCLLSDYLTWWMTGRFTTEAGAAGLTGLIDIRRLMWWDSALERFGLRREWMPEVVRAGTDLGVLRPAIAERLHLPEDCRFVVGCLDQYAGAIGVGNVVPGALSETTGTVLATVRCTGEFDAGERSGVFCGPTSEPGRYYQMVFGSISANLLEFYREQLDSGISFADLDHAASKVAPGAAGLRLSLNHREDEVRNQLSHWAKHHEPGDATRAILEGVAFALREQVALLCRDEWPREIACAGGAARSALWRQIKADVLGVPTVSLACPEPTSLGAALLAIGALSGRPLHELVDACVVRDAIARPDEAMYTTYTTMRAGE